MKNYTLKQFINRLDNKALKVEDCTKIEIDGQAYTLVCIAKDHDKQKDGSTVPYTFNIYELLNNGMAINKTWTNRGGWEKSNIRRELSKIKSKLPKEISDRIVPVIKSTSAGEGKADIIETEDEIFLFSEIEIFGKNEYSEEGEGKQYKFFEEWRNRFKRYINRDWSSPWWLRSPYYGYSSSFVYVGSSGYADDINASSAFGVSFGFCLK